MKALHRLKQCNVFRRYFNGYRITKIFWLSEEYAVADVSPEGGIYTKAMLIFCVLYELCYLVTSLYLSCSLQISCE